MRRILAVVVLCALALSGAAFAGEPGFTPVEPASPNAERINQSYLWVAIFTGAIFVLVQGTLIWFIVRYRADRRSREHGRRAGARQHEPGARLDGRAGPDPGRDRLLHLLQAPRDRGRPRCRPGRGDAVKGHRYYWNFIYPNGVIAVDRLRAPVGQTTRLEVTAPDYDVIHSWWIPALGGKFDAIPGRVNETWFNAEAPGIYRGQCAELCGGQHALMTAEVEAMPPRRVRRVARARSPRAGERGRRTSARRRSAAPARSATGSPARATSGPPLAGNQLLDDPEAVEQVVRNGSNEMPPVGESWDERQMEALTEYLQEELLGG